MDRSSLSVAERDATFRWMEQDAARSAELRAQEADAITELLLILQTQRGVDPTVLAAAVAEQAARTQLSDQAWRNAVAARTNLAAHGLGPL